MSDFLVAVAGIMIGTGVIKIILALVLRFIPRKEGK